MIFVDLFLMSLSLHQNSEVSIRIKKNYFNMPLQFELHFGSKPRLYIVIFIFLKSAIKCTLGI